LALYTRKGSAEARLAKSKGIKDEYLTWVAHSTDIVVKKEKQVIDELIQDSTTTTSEEDRQQLYNSNIIHYMDITLVARACFSIKEKKWYVYLGTLDDEEIFKSAEQEQHSKESDLEQSVRAMIARPEEEADPNQPKQITSRSGGGGRADFIIMNSEFIDILMNGKISILNRTEKEYRSVKPYQRKWLLKKKIFNITRELEQSPQQQKQELT
jgi:hypothetical protein